MPVNVAHWHKMNEMNELDDNAPSTNNESNEGSSGIEYAATSNNSNRNDLKYTSSQPRSKPFHGPWPHSAHSGKWRNVAAFKPITMANEVSSATAVLEHDVLAREEHRKNLVLDALQVGVETDLFVREKNYLCNKANAEHMKETTGLQDLHQGMLKLSKETSTMAATKSTSWSGNPLLQPDPDANGQNMDYERFDHSNGNGSVDNGDPYYTIVHDKDSMEEERLLLESISFSIAQNSNENNDGFITSTVENSPADAGFFVGLSCDDMMALEEERVLLEHIEKSIAYSNSENRDRKDKASDTTELQNDPLLGTEDEIGTTSSPGSNVFHEATRSSLTDMASQVPPDVEGCTPLLPDLDLVPRNHPSTVRDNGRTSAQPLAQDDPVAMLQTRSDYLPQGILMRPIPFCGPCASSRNNSVEAESSRTKTREIVELSDSSDEEQSTFQLKSPTSDGIFGSSQLGNAFSSGACEVIDLISSSDDDSESQPANLHCCNGISTKKEEMTLSYQAYVWIFPGVTMLVSQGFKGDIFVAEALSCPFLRWGEWSVLVKWTVRGDKDTVYCRQCQPVLDIPNKKRELGRGKRSSIKTDRYSPTGALSTKKRAKKKLRAAKPNAKHSNQLCVANGNQVSDTMHASCTSKTSQEPSTKRQPATNKKYDIRQKRKGLKPNLNSNKQLQPSTENVDAYTHVNDIQTRRRLKSQEWQKELLCSFEACYDSRQSDSCGGGVITRREIKAGETFVDGGVRYHPGDPPIAEADNTRGNYIKVKKEGYFDVDGQMTILINEPRGSQKANVEWAVHYYDTKHGSIDKKLKWRVIKNMDKEEEVLVEYRKELG